MPLAATEVERAVTAFIVENFLFVLAGRGREAEALVHMRTYREEVAEALEAVGAGTKDAKR